MSKGELDGQVAIVTGGTGGIGLATSAVLVRNGSRVVVVGTNDEHIRAAVDELNCVNAASTLGLRLDVRSELDMHEMVRGTIDQFGRVDILIACAGVGKARHAGGGVPRPVSHLSIEEFDQIVDINLKGVFLSNRAVLPAMISQGRGQIINISSWPGGIAGQPFSAAYCASKFGVNGLSEALAAEVAPFGIRVQVVFPGATDTPLIRGTPLAVQFGHPLPASRIAEHIFSLITAPEETTCPSGRDARYSVLRPALGTPNQPEMTT